MSWRSISEDERENFLIEVDLKLSSRQKMGEDTYGNEFKGDPLTQLEEELLDALFYVFMARKERGAIIENLYFLRRRKGERGD